MVPISMYTTFLSLQEMGEVMARIDYNKTMIKGKSGPRYDLLTLYFIIFIDSFLITENIWTCKLFFTIYKIIFLQMFHKKL